MKRFALLVVSLSCAAMAEDRAVWLQQTKLGDAEFAQAHYPEAEEAFRAALKAVTPTDDVDPNYARLALLSNRLGRCTTGDDTTDVLLRVLRVDLTGAKPALVARVKEAPKDGCWSSLVHQSLALVYRAEGRHEEAAALSSVAAKLRCKSVVANPLEDAVAALTDTWRFAERRAQLEATAEKTLGVNHPLVATVRALHAGKPLAVPQTCSDERDVHEWKRLGEAGDRAFSKKRYVDAERWYRAALAMLVGDALDPNSERLAASLRAQGTCATGDLTLDALVALHRGDVGSARVLGEAAVHKLPTEPLRSTLFPNALVFSLWLEGKPDEAREIEKSVAEVRERPARVNVLDAGLMHLNWAWMQPEQRSTNEKFAAKYLGANHPLFALYAAKRDGKKLPVSAACRAK